MKTKFTTEDKINFLYGLMSEQDLQRFKQALNDDDSLRDELEELKKTRSLFEHGHMVKAPQVNPASIMRAGSFSWKRVLFQSSKYAAVLLVIVIVLGSISNLNIQYDHQGLTVSMSLLPTPNLHHMETVQPPDRSAEIQQQTLAMLSQFQQQQSELLSELIAVERNEQNKVLQELFNEYAMMIENRRMIDLQLIQFELEDLQQQQNNRIYRAELLLGSLIENLTYND